MPAHAVTSAPWPYNDRQVQQKRRSPLTVTLKAARQSEASGDGPACPRDAYSGKGVYATPLELFRG